jgi:hypothetical protein
MIVSVVSPRKIHLEHPGFFEITISYWLVSSFFGEVATGTNSAAASARSRPRLR